MMLVNELLFEMFVQDRLHLPPFLVLRAFIVFPLIFSCHSPDTLVFKPSVLKLHNLDSDIIITLLVIILLNRTINEVSYFLKDDNLKPKG